MTFEPSYVNLLESGSFPQRVTRAKERLSPCTVCAVVCRVQRQQGDLGECGVGAKAIVSSYGPHFGEEAPLRGWKGSGTIFFSGCNMHCQFCQNASISQAKVGQEVTPHELAEMMLQLQKRGCHNINFVSPTHVGPQLMEGVYLAAQKGLQVPLVYNTGGYDSVSMLRLFDGIIDIYMPDMKYADPDLAYKYSRIEHYPTVNQRAVKEMHRQVGDLQVNEEGLAQKGLLVRHLVLPHGMAGSEEVLGFLAREVSPRTYVNLMDQYRPSYRAHEYPRLNRRLRRDEFMKVREYAEELGLERAGPH